MRRLAVLSMHTSPLAQPGAGDGGGMNVYVRELAAALARSGVECDVYTRAWSADLPAVRPVEPGFRVHHVPAGPLAPVAKERLPELVDEFTDGVLHHIRDRRPADAIHANYWLSGVAGHALKHELGIPLVSTFHTLALVKAEGSDDEPAARAGAEQRVMACSDVVTASCSTEAAQLQRLYGVDPARIATVAPGVEHAFFSPGHQGQARTALSLPDGVPVVLFVGRIQPLKGLDVAVRALAALRSDAHLVVVGGASGVDGPAEVQRVRDLAASLGVARRMRFVAPQPHHRLSTFYRAADVCVVPSRSESFGLVALEAAACGTPVVAAAVGGLRTLVDDGRTGFLVESRDPSAFADRLGTVLGDDVLRARLGRAAAARAQRYTWSAAATALWQVSDHLTRRQLVECA